jgi:hypothetical protein
MTGHCSRAYLCGNLATSSPSWKARAESDVGTATQAEFETRKAKLRKRL